MECDVKVVTVEALQRATRGFGIRPLLEVGASAWSEEMLGARSLKVTYLPYSGLFFTEMISVLITVSVLP